MCSRIRDRIEVKLSFVAAQDSDNSAEEEGLPSLHNRIDASSGEAAMRGLSEERVRRVYSSITYHSKNVGWNDEFKLDLPVHIRPVHHLLFTFYNVSCKDQKKVATTKSLIGYAILPLLQQHRVADEK
mgnify:CR=1 FL=1